VRVSLVGTATPRLGFRRLPALQRLELAVQTRNLDVQIGNLFCSRETSIADPNQDVVYGLGHLSLEKGTRGYSSPRLWSRDELGAINPFMSK